MERGDGCSHDNCGPSPPSSMSDRKSIGGSSSQNLGADSETNRDLEGPEGCLRDVSLGCLAHCKS